MVLGGSTNAVLHLIAIAHSVGIKLDIDDFQNVSNCIPFLADIKPSGKYVMEDVYKIGGIPSEPFKHNKWFLLIGVPSVLDRDLGIFIEKQINRRRQHDSHGSYFGRKSRAMDS